MTRARFHVPGAAPGARLPLPEHSGHHARDVLRLRPGAELSVFDGEGNEYAAVLVKVTRAEVTCHITGPAPSRPESPLRLVLAVSPLKGDLMELVIQKATELGVSEIRPVVTVRTDAVARPALRGARHERWEKVASGAAEQCGRSVVPAIQPAVLLRDFLRQPFEGLRVVLDETPGSPALAALDRPSAALMLVGPAGGWEESEIDALRAAGFRAASLGPRILRAETAAIAAVTAAQVVWGDLGR